MKRLVAALLVALLAPLPSRAESPQDRLTQGKIDADLGRYEAATAAFTAVSQSRDAPVALRVESLVRLGAVRRAAGDHEGALQAFERAAKDPGLDRDTKALLVQALGGAVPGLERWDAVWSRVTFVVDREGRTRPGLAIRWPDLPTAESRPFTGEKISVDLKESDILDVLRLFSDLGKVNVVTDPGVQGRVTLALKDVPWDEALDRILTTNGLTSHRDGNIVWVSATGGLGSKKTYSGQPVSMDFKNGELADVLRLFADISELNIVAPGVSGKISLSVDDMPWDKAFDIALKMHGLALRREGNVLWISSGWMPALRNYTGRAIDVDLKNQSVAEALEEVARIGGGRVAIDPSVKEGPRTSPITLKLKQVPWDQAMDLVARWGYLELTGEGDALAVRPILQGPRAGRRGGLALWRVRDLSLRGIVKAKSGAIALVLTPDGKTWFAQSGAKLQNGTVRAIDDAGVTYDEEADGASREVRQTLRADAASAAPPAAKGHTVSADFKDADLSDVFRLIADVSGRNVVVFPGVKGRTTLAAKDMPWDEVLRRVLGPNGLALQWAGNVVTIGPPEHIGTARRGAGVGAFTKYSGEPIQLDLKDADLVGALAQIAQANGATVRFDPRIRGRVTIKLNEVPWDQALDVIVKTNGLEWTREGNTFSILVPRKPGALAAPEGPLTPAPKALAAELGLDQATLRGILAKDKKAAYVALLEGPERKTYTVTVGTKLEDATVVALDATTVTFRAASGGDLRKTLYPPR